MDLRLVRRGRETSKAAEVTEIIGIDLKGWQSSQREGKDVRDI